MKLRLLASSLAAFALAVAPGAAALGSDTIDHAASERSVGPVFVGSTDLIYLESYPVQVRLMVQGSLPTPCHEPVWEVKDHGASIEVRLWSETDPDQNCIQVLQPFEVSIPLGSFESSSSPVFLNGALVGRLDLGAVATPSETPLAGAGWSFGMCVGYCSADLVVEGDLLLLTGRGRTGQEPLYINTGTLTTTALDRIDAAAKTLEGETLDQIYGCPDCADGGSTYLTLSHDGIVTRHEMEFASPPRVLAEMHALATVIIDALETCQSNELVTVADDCEPSHS